MIARLINLFLNPKKCHLLYFPLASFSHTSISPSNPNDHLLSVQAEAKKAEEKAAKADAKDKAAAQKVSA